MFELLWTRGRRHAAACGLVALGLAGVVTGQVADRDKALRVIRPERKLALVIGNEAYANQWALKNPVNDAQAVAGVLRQELGFDEVELLTDIGTDVEMKVEVEDFGKRLRPNDLAFFYYSGHGIEVENSNYLLPTGFEENTAERFVAHKTLPQEWVQTALRQARLSVMVLDACRNNPYTKGSGGGWVHEQPRPEEGKGMVIAYATDQGKTASDRGEGLGLYAGHLVEVLQEPGLELQAMFQRVKERVTEVSDGDQRPQHYPDVIGSYYFVPQDSGADVVAGSTNETEVVRTGIGEAEERARELLAGAERLLMTADVMETREAELELLKEARKQLTGITHGHPGTATARSLSSGELVGRVSLAGIESRIAELELPRVGPAGTQEEVRLPPPPPSADAPRAGEQREYDGMEFVWVPAGEFLMGSESAEAFDDESPVREVRISAGYWLGKHEVTQGEWEAVMGSNPSRFQNCGRDCPVEGVSWEDVQAFIGRLNGGSGGNRYRLPSEAEWEYAARAGASGDRYGADMEAIGWHSGNSGGSPRRVGRKAPNAWGLHDMLGNVWEWVEDWYGDYAGGYVTDPRGPATGSSRVGRGGSWYGNARHCRSSNRGNAPPGLRGNDLGFRLLRTE